MGELDKVHARIMLVELLRDTAPPIERWGDRLVSDAMDLALSLAVTTSKEWARRLAARSEGSGGEQSPQGSE